MSAPKELSFEEILKVMLAHNGKITNHELVNYFKVFLTNPNRRDDARNMFKKHVNTLAVIKNQNNEKWLILKKKYMPSNSQDIEKPNTPVTDSQSSSSVNAPMEPMPPPYQPPPPIQLNQDFNVLNCIIQNYKPSELNPLPELQVETVKLDVTSTTEDVTSPTEDLPPKIYPRKRSSDKSNEKRSSITKLTDQNDATLSQEDEVTQIICTENLLSESEQTISVKERKQMFNRLASENDVLKANKSGGNTALGVDEDDRASLDPKSESDPLDSKQKQWILCAARGDYHALAKMCKENPKLVKTKDPFTTAMHWACKRGDEDLVKLLAGVARQVVNERSGYTPLHIAMQFRHENVFRLLVEVYDADPNVRDWSGRKPRQYFVYMDTTLSPGSYHKKESFLRIGSLNVRVKKTTEAFSNFLGVGATRSSTYLPKTRDRDLDGKTHDDHLHKSWGSADNIVYKEDKLMPPPLSGKVKRRGGNSRKGLAAHSQSTPSTPDQPRAHLGGSEEGNSDSDSAAGFHSAWRQQRASCS